jgi:hypothetical protein
MSKIRSDFWEFVRLALGLLVMVVVFFSLIAAAFLKLACYIKYLLQ